MSVPGVYNICYNVFMTHKMKLQSTPFDKIKNGEKTIEVRLNDEKRQLIKVDDEIEFNLNTDFNQLILVKVVELLPFKNFKDLYYSIDLKETGDLNKDDFIKMYKYYSKEDEEKYGVLGIRFVLM